MPYFKTSLIPSSPINQHSGDHISSNVGLANIVKLKQIVWNCVRWNVMFSWKVQHFE